MTDPGSDEYVRTIDHALTTTRAVRKRLDFDRPVDDRVLLDCIDVAEQAPTGGNLGSRRWMIIRDQQVKDRLAELYLSAGGSWVIETAQRLEGTGHQNERMMQGARHLAENVARCPALVIPTILGVHDASGRPGLFDSVIQSAWSFMVALRARGLGTVWTTMYLNEAPAVADLLAIPDGVTQICLFPVAYSIGTDFSPSTRRHPARDITYFGRYGHTRPADETGSGSGSQPGVVAEADMKADPDAVRSMLDAALPSIGVEGTRVVVEQVPGGSRARVHAAAGGDPDDVIRRLREILADVTGRAEAGRRSR